MLRKTFLITITLSAVYCAPQFVSFKEGKVGVNFGGYNAEAGLGGLLTGNAAHGGLSASAGTPYGQSAAAGIGGSSAGGSSGGAYAGATAGGNVGASAGLGGVVSDAVASGGLGAAAQAGGVSQDAVGNSEAGFQITKQVAVAQPVVEGEVGFYAGGGSQASAGVAAQAGGEVNSGVAVVKNVNAPKKYVPAVAQTNVVLEKRIEIPSVQAQVSVNAGASSNVGASKSVVVPQVVPVQQSSVAASQANVFGFQKTFNYAPPVVPFTTVYKPPVFAFRKHFRPWHQRFYVQKQFAPIVYQPQPVVVAKQKQVYVAPAPPPPPPPQPIVPVPVPVISKSASFSGGAQGSFQGGTLFDSIFNIPIQTLKAVNGFLNTKANAGGGVAFQKSFSLQG